VCRRAKRPHDVSNRRGERRPGRLAQAPEVDAVDAQISALLESVEADKTEAVPPTRPSRRARASARKRSRSRSRERSTEAARDRPQPRVATAAPARGGFTPKVVVEPRIPWFGDPANRERAYYLIAALISGTGLGLLCARLLQ
jgi:hypothetical protein